MNTMEFNKFFGAGCAALLVFLLANFASEAVFHMEDPEEPAYALEIEQPAGAADDAAPQVDLPALLASADVAEGEKIFRKCAACHKLEEGVNSVGPSLWGVVGRKVDSVAGYNYSGALEKVADVWSFENLSHFIENPKGWAPGTKMGFAGLAKPQERADVIAYLNQADGTPEPLPAAQEAAAPEAAPAKATAEATQTEPAPTPKAEATQAEPAPATEAASAPADEARTAEAAPAPEAPKAESEKPAAQPAAAAGDDFAAALASATVEDGKAVFRKCGACHKVEEGRNMVGPSLWGVVGRPIASIDGFSYSDALKAKEGEWTFDNLNAFLSGPKAWAPGTKMTFAGLPKIGDRAAVVKFLNEADGTPVPLP